MENLFDLDPMETSFDIMGDAQAQARNLHMEMKAAGRKTAELAWQLGGLLKQAKARLNHGDWTPWLEGAKIDPRTARRYMQLHEEKTEKEAIESTIRGLLYGGEDAGEAKTVSETVLPEGKKPTKPKRKVEVHGGPAKKRLDPIELQNELHAAREELKRYEGKDTATVIHRSRSEKLEAWGNDLLREIGELREALAEALNELRKRGVELEYHIEAAADTAFPEVDAFQ